MIRRKWRPRESSGFRERTPFEQIQRAPVVQTHTAHRTARTNPCEQTLFKVVFRDTHANPSEVTRRSTSRGTCRIGCTGVRAVSTSCAKTARPNGRSPPTQGCCTCYRTTPMVCARLECARFVPSDAFPSPRQLFGVCEHATCLCTRERTHTQG